MKKYKKLFNESKISMLELSPDYEPAVRLIAEINENAIGNNLQELNKTLRALNEKGALKEVTNLLEYLK